MIYVRRRIDLKEQGLLIPTRFKGHQELDEWRLATQPDDIEDSEFNTILLTDNKEVYDIAMSIDLEFMPICDCGAVADITYSLKPVCEQCKIDMIAGA